MNKKKVIRLSVKFILVILLIFVAGYFILKEVIRRNIIGQLRGPHPFVKLNVADVHVNLLTASVGIDSLMIDFPSLGSKTGQIPHASIPKATIKGIGLLQFALHKRLLAKDVTLENAELFLDSSLISKKDSILRQIKSPVTKLFVRRLSCENVSLTIRTSDANANIIRAYGSFIIQELTIDTSRKKQYPFKSFRLGLSNISYTLPNGMHVLRIKELDLDSKKENVVMRQIHFVPMFGKEKFFRKIGRQADRIDGKINSIEIEHLDIAALMQRKLVAEKMVIGSAKVHVFRDRRYPRPQNDIPLPMQDIRTTKMDVRIKTVELQPSVVEYEEQPKEGGETGTLRIERLKLSISPFASRYRKSDPDYLELKTEGSLEGTGSIEATMMLPIKPGLPYLVNGAFHKLELTKLNSSSENLGRIHIKSGFLDFLYFDFSMSESESSGKIIGAYHRLVIQRLKKHTNEKKVEKFSSFMLRNFIIPLNKPASLPERKRIGEVHYKRDPSRQFSYYLLQSLLTGVKKSFTLGFLLPK